METLTDLQGEIESNTIKIGDFTKLLSIVDRPTWQDK